MIGAVEGSMAQLRGTGYAVAEIVWWMLAALIVGIAIGWLLRSFRRERRVEAHYASELETSQQRSARLESQLADARAEAAAARSLIDDGRDELSVTRRRIDELQRELASLQAAASKEQVDPEAAGEVPREPGPEARTDTDEAPQQPSERQQPSQEEPVPSTSPTSRANAASAPAPDTLFDVGEPVDVPPGAPDDGPDATPGRDGPDSGVL